MTVGARSRYRRQRPGRRRVRDSRGLPSAAVGPTGEIRCLAGRAFSQGAYDGIALSSPATAGSPGANPAHQRPCRCRRVRPQHRLSAPTAPSCQPLRPGVASSAGALTTTYRLTTSADDGSTGARVASNPHLISPRRRSPMAGSSATITDRLVAAGFGALYARHWRCEQPHRHRLRQSAEGTLKFAAPRYLCDCRHDRAAASSWLREAALQAAGSHSPVPRPSRRRTATPSPVAGGQALVLLQILRRRAARPNAAACPVRSTRRECAAP